MKSRILSIPGISMPIVDAFSEYRPLHKALEEQGYLGKRKAPRKPRTRANDSQITGTGALAEQGAPRTAVGEGIRGGQDA